MSATSSCSGEPCHQVQLSQDGHFIGSSEPMHNKCITNKKKIISRKLFAVKGGERIVVDDKAIERIL